MTAPDNPPPPPRPGRDGAPLDPESSAGRAMAARLTRTLAQIELELAAREQASGRIGRAA